ncbi:hypothetical protein BHU72_09910 [Desulfuribacillus stibiiarsenatis]|uniref:Uncharacterized protein n=1 Tax=Desulfuribacillus stibiiarsenatis TaxID=1390249 RepID=A0A1E5L2Z5_9FIRM|nr:hypothetical protein [Desulfuribacillus stibiiarsenatis]OEH84510.1 hypothetical protein BHU72_09910 [Desulfuribacillus stibiiarsenatis]
MRVKKLFICILVVVLALVVLSACKHSELSDATFKNEIPGVTGPGSKTITFGLYDLDGKINDAKFIDNGENTFIKKLSIGHYLDQESTYMIMLFTDFIQQKFWVANELSNNHSVKINPNSAINFEINAEIPKNTKELAIIIVRNPDSTSNGNNLKKSLNDQNTFVLRYLIENDGLIEKKYLKPVSTNSKALEEVFLSQSNIKHELLFEKKGDSPVHLLVGNMNNQKLDYSLIALYDWQQVQIENKLVNYASVEPGQTNVYDIYLPPSKMNNLPFQILAFPAPFDENSAFSKNMYSTFRIAIQ